MILKNSILVVFFIVLGCNDKPKQERTVLTEPKEASASSYLIEVDDLLKIVATPNIKIIDFRKPEFYSKGHIVGAVNIWRPAIEDASYPYGGMMASKAQIETLFSNLGIGSGDEIIIYDDNGLCDASRLWWILQNYNFTKVKLFHGGINAWKQNNGVVSNEVNTIEKATFKLAENSSMKYYLSKNEVVEVVNADVVILDTRTEDEFSGKRQKKGAARGGRIPNSKLINWTSALDFSGNKKLKPVAELQTIYEKFASVEDTIIVYCHSGVRSAHTTFVLTQLLGYKNVKNYDGSWTEWSHFENLPLEKDSITIIKN